MWILAFVCALASLPLAANEVKTEKTAPWNGAELAADQGVFFVQSTFIDTAAQTREAHLEFWLVGKSDQHVYNFEWSVTNPGKSSQWPLKADSYELIRIRSLDSEGRDWNWRPTTAPIFQVEAGAISHFGHWFLVQVKKGQKLSLLIKPARMLPLFKLPKSFSRMIDGETHAELFTSSEKTPPPQRSAAPVPDDLGVDMKLDLFRQSSQEPQMLQILQDRSGSLRSCYFEYLERNPKVSGQLAFTFIYSGSEHSIKSLKIKQADLRDQHFVQCLTDTIKGLSFPIEKSLIGELSFSFQKKGS